MGDSQSIVPSLDVCEGDKHVIAATRHIVKALVLTNNMSNDLREILVDLDTRLSRMTTLGENDTGGTSEPGDRFLCANENVISWQCDPRGHYEVEDRLIYAQKKVIRWQSDQSMIWDSGPDEASEYLQAVDEVRRLAESLGSLLSQGNGKEKELLDSAHGVLQMAMTRLEEELLHILIQNKQFSELECLSLHSCEENVAYSESFVSTEDYSGDVSSCVESGGPAYEYYVTDLVRPDVISDIKSIANVMFASNYSQEFCQVFVNFWKDAMEEYLVVLGIDIFSIGDVLKMDWSILNYRIKQWCRAMKIIFRSFLASEKMLFDQILGNYQSISATSFLDATSASMRCLLNFGEAVAIGSIQPHCLFRIIDMYEVLASLIHDIDALFVEDDGSFLRTEYHNLLGKLANSIKATLMEFKNHIASYSSVTPFPKGGIHQLTRYVMNYIIALVDCSDTLASLFPDAIHADNRPTNSEVSCPMTDYLLSVTLTLEKKLCEKATLYQNCSLMHIFMMNNIHYMVKKVKESKLATYIDHEWIRKNTWKYQNHATNYERATWSTHVLSLLKDDRNAGKANLKETYRLFNIAFEEVYKNQTAWSVQDSELREELQIRTLHMVIPAYWNFSTRTSKCIRDKYIKYTTDDLQNYIMDLFEGSPKTLNNFWKR